MPTPHQNPARAALLHPQPQRGGGGKKNGGNAGCHHGPKAQTGLKMGTKTTCGFAGAMTMICVGGGGAFTTMTCGGGGAGSTVMICCSLDARLPASFAFARRNWTESMTSAGWARNASPRSRTHCGFSPNIASTCGNATSDCTLGSHGLSCTAVTAASPLSLRFANAQSTANATSDG